MKKLSKFLALTLTSGMLLAACGDANNTDEPVADPNVEEGLEDDVDNGMDNGMDDTDTDTDTDTDG